jgi:hypothetical protein
VKCLACNTLLDGNYCAVCSPMAIRCPEHGVAPDSDCTPNMDACYVRRIRARTMRWDAFHNLSINWARLAHYLRITRAA